MKLASLIKANDVWALSELWVEKENYAENRRLCRNRGECGKKRQPNQPMKELINILAA
jgi:hypothetical protein